jgi:hypothetical protein
MSGAADAAVRQLRAVRPPAPRVVHGPEDGVRNHGADHHGGCGRRRCRCHQVRDYVRRRRADVLVVGIDDQRCDGETADWPQQKW